MSLRVLVAEDSSTVRRHLVAVLAADPAIAVVGEARDGAEAVELCRTLAPDVVTLDIGMPGIDGLAATERIMAFTPTPILVVTATSRGEVASSFKALAAGAVEVLEKPCGDADDASWERRFIDLVKLVARVRVITHVRGRRERTGTSGASTAVPAAIARHQPRLVALGASTGGPRALCAILGALPADFPLPILVALHVGEQFSSGLADWLAKAVALPVAFAHDGEPLPPSGSGCVRLAPPGRHLTVADGLLRLDRDPPRLGFRPSIDVLFESVARAADGAAIAGMLTGMGRDGARGLLAIRRGGGATFAQDEETSVVFGMARAAIELDAVDEILPLPGIAPALCRWVAQVQR